MTKTLETNRSAGRGWLRLFGLALVLLAGACASPPRTGEAGSRPPVILVSLDGFRQDYLDRGGLHPMSETRESGTVLVNRD